MSIQNVVAQIAVSNIKGAIKWYGRLLGQIHGSANISNLARWRLPRGGWLQLRASREHAGGSAVCLMVNNLDAQRSALERAGLAFEIPAPGEAGDVATLLDPDGNTITLEQTLKPSPEAFKGDLRGGHMARERDAAPPPGEDQLLIASLHGRIAQLEKEAEATASQDSARLTGEALSNAARR